MKALVISTTGFIGGGEIALNILVRYLITKEKMKFYFLSQRGEVMSLFSGPGIELMEEDYRYPRFYAIQRRIREIVASIKPNFILVNGRKGAIFLPFTGVPSYLWLHLPFKNEYDGAIKSGIMFKIAKSTFKRFEKIYYVSEEIGEELKLLGFENIRKLYPPLDPEVLEGKTNDEILNLKLKNKVVISYISRIEKVKGQLEVAEYLSRSGLLEGLSAVLVFAGKGSLLERLKSYEGRDIKVLGHVEDIGPLLRASDIYFLFSRTEGLPLSMLEAMYYGAIPVVRPVGEIPYVIKDGVNGVIIKELGQFEEKMNFAISRRSELLKGAMKTAEDFFVDKIASSFLEEICF